MRLYITKFLKCVVLFTLFNNEKGCQKKEFLLITTRKLVFAKNTLVA